jgi:membrane protease YdiL (CAAX protease family)
LAATNSTSFPLAVSSQRSFSRDLAELIFVFGAIMVVLWLPTRQQLVFGPLVLLTPLALTLWRKPSLDDLGLSWRRLTASLWILPTAIVLALLSVWVARSWGTFHPLYKADIEHVGGYVLWTFYQQFLLQDYFLPRLTRLLSADTAIAVAGSLFAVAHLPNLSLAIATLVWGVVSCLLFRRYRSLYVLGLVQGLLGLCFAVCVPNALHHHMRVGLGYLRYHVTPPRS